MSTSEMPESRLLELYDRVAEAPDAIDRLRKFVLDLAVRGKLVEQDPNDEPAEELLKRIAAEKAKLVKDGRIKKPKPSTPISPSEVPIEVPGHWTWLRLGDIGVLSGGMTPSKNQPDYWDGDVIWLSPKDIKTDEVADSELKITEKGVSETRLQLFPTGSLFIVARSGILKRTFPVAINRVPAASNQDLKVLVPFLKGQERYLQIMFRGLTDFLLSELVKTGTTVQSLKYTEFAIQPFPLPPLPEQRRIVAKVDELMALLDRLEITRTQRETTRDRLTTSSLARLTAPETTEKELRAHARFALDNLDQLSSRPEQIKVLRQTILNLAVRGKLVEQDPGDEPVDLPNSDLPVSPETLPNGWRYVPLSLLLSENTRNGYSRRPDDAENGVPILRISAGTVRQDGIVAEEEHKLISGIDDATRFQYGLAPDDLLACRFNGNKEFVGRLKIFTDYLGLRPIYPDKLIRLRLNRQRALPEFIRMASESSLVRKSVENYCATTVGNWGISASNLKEVPFPLPPLAEQRRIVVKTEELLNHLDRLEASIEIAGTTRIRLLDNLLHEDLAPATDRALAAVR